MQVELEYHEKLFVMLFNQQSDEFQSLTLLRLYDQFIGRHVYQDVGLGERFRVRTALRRARTLCHDG